MYYRQVRERTSSRRSTVVYTQQQHRCEHTKSRQQAAFTTTLANKQHPGWRDGPLGQQQRHHDRPRLAQRRGGLTCVRGDGRGVPCQRRCCLRIANAPEDVGDGGDDERPRARPSQIARPSRVSGRGVAPSASHPPPIMGGHAPCWAAAGVGSSSVGRASARPPLKTSSTPASSSKISARSPRGMPRSMVYSLLLSWLGSGAARHTVPPSGPKQSTAMPRVDARTAVSDTGASGPSAKPTIGWFTCSAMLPAAADQ